MKKLLLLFALFILSEIILAQQKQLLVRVDDIGMSHSVNLALQKVIDTGIPFSASVMVPCPWFREAVEILKQNPQVSVGIHLTLNSEWKNYKWGPVLGMEAVPGLVDELGYFFPSRALLQANNPTIEEIENELRAQIEKALTAGLKIDYLDYHMGAAVEVPEHCAIVEKLADEYGLGISQYLHEFYSNNMYNDPYEQKADSLYFIMNNLKEDKVNLLVCHIGVDDPELAAMEDENSFGLREMSKHRQAELNALTSEKFLNLINQNNIKLVNYRTLIDEVGLENMKRPSTRK